MRWENRVDRVPETKNCDQQVHWLRSLPIQWRNRTGQVRRKLESHVDFVCVCPEVEIGLGTAVRPYASFPRGQFQTYPTFLGFGRFRKDAGI